ncbi:MAG: DUF2102 domain-containing protein [Candidatus Methanomethylophilaceae archaeon]|jgi:putative methanogenesis marker protein 6|nr:hypothetical protein AOA81_00965 [Methanomassiliicoccales archaeon RumEn M2]MDI9378800.1 methanogenesis marker protein 6 [Candidatus Thermoplasmatota archaeon]
MSENKPRQRETRLIMISPASNVTPDQLARTVHAMGRELSVKETCYGCLLEGDPKTVVEVRDELRKLDPHGIYSKRRAYPAGDPRRCRAQHGTRPGYSQLEAEWKLLANLQHAMDAIDMGEKAPPEPKRNKLPVKEFKEICEVNL